MILMGSKASAQPLAFGPAVGVGVGIGPGGTWAGPVVGPAWGGPWGPWGYGPRVGPWFGPGLWGWGWPWWGGAPGAIGSFWTNGLPLYGPPVPTFGPVPGSFGGSDAHRMLNNGPLGLYDPFYQTTPQLRGPQRDFPPAVLPPDYAGPRFATRKVRERYAQQKADPMLGIARAYDDLARAEPWRYGRSTIMDPCLRVRVLVPTDDCTVWIQEQPTRATGTERWFQSPPLSPGASYTYRITAKPGDGPAEARTVTGKAGETVTVEFGTPTPYK